MRALFLSTYPVSGEQSGGVVRLAALKQALEGAGHRTHVLAVVLPGSTARRREDETVLPVAAAAFSRADWRAGGFHDVLTGLRALADPALLEEARALARAWRPEVYVLEQPFLVLVAEEMVRTHPAPIVYSAANVEAPLKRDLIAIAGDHFHHPEDLAAEVDRLERRAVALAELVVAIAPSVLETVAGWGARWTLFCGNGSRLAERKPAAGHPLARHVANPRFTVFGCFGSAYWPNVEGLAAVASPSLAFLPIHARLALAGRLAQHLRAHPSYRRGQRLNESRLVDFGFLDEDAFDVLIQACDALVLPVFVGGGSPLKTADALASGRPVILSRQMTSGYEDVIAAVPDGVEVADDPASFRRLWRDMARLSKAEIGALAGVGRHRAAMLTWSERLSAFPAALAEVASQRPRQGTEGAALSR